MAIEWGIALMAGMTFLLSFYVLFFIAHLMDWSVRTLSGGKQGLILDLVPEKTE